MNVLSARLQVIHSADAGAQGRVYALGADEVSLGREATSTIVIATEQASRQHARIVLVGEAHLLQDLGSTNGTFVNSKPVTEQRLQPGDVLRIASTVMKYLVEP
ncbi:MAG: FHA domain-containing protein [Anaeromyxobacter sp.]|nr:FHA domain-containing protein [Anaeromyxobacter sp.]MBL0276343.1 FHA domain-containing protein [Anaeromyxobacter sp.]